MEWEDWSSMHLLPHFHLTFTRANKNPILHADPQSSEGILKLNKKNCLSFPIYLLYSQKIFMRQEHDRWGLRAEEVWEGGPRRRVVLG